MAIDQTQKRQAIAREIMNHVDLMMESLYAARDKANEAASAGLDFIDTDFSSSTDMKHITDANFGTVLSNIPAVVTEWESEFLDDVFNMIRP